MNKLPFNKALVLAPHTDDGEFGCGGTIARLLREGCQIKYVAFSDCKESIPAGLPADTLEKEMRTATARLGLKDVELLDFQVRYFNYKRQDILESLIQVKRSFQPDVVFTPCSQDIHQDHKTITEEAIRAFKDGTILGYELPWNNLTLPSTCLLYITQEDVDKKIHAIEAYQSQTMRAYASPDYITALALTRGIRIKTTYAEAFEVIRLIL